MAPPRKLSSRAEDVRVRRMFEAKVKADRRTLKYLEWLLSLPAEVARLRAENENLKAQIAEDTNDHAD